ncbi:hypothetical protein [Draconibacterium orientale]|uniref:hypothetical protein n=1 Tax=Draconibacterium orientale TaxID=1168034 RepID=UPI0029C098BB|nr:hypothetical protein [Draconibacterium orientale]
MKISSYIFFIAFCFLCLGRVQGQNTSVNIRFSIPEVALIDIEPGEDNTVHFSVSSTTESGEAPEVTETSSKSLWINYTSAQSDNSDARSVYAEITEGGLPEGLELEVEASAYKGSGKGDMLGTKEGKIVLSQSPQKIISNVKNCFTGDGVGNGHELTYTLKIADYSEIVSTDDTYFVVMYTLTDN